jgi:tRNA dimethylallyltransferase
MSNHSGRARRRADITLTNGRENTILCQHFQEGEPQTADRNLAAVQASAPRLLVLVGPTAVGKTAVAVELAQQISGEIVSVDSMQVYKYMDIGTAKPNIAERRLVPFHLIDIVTPDQQLTASEWKGRAEEVIAGIHSRNNIAIVCGGTGLYVSALLNDWQLAGTPANPELRLALREKVVKTGSLQLHGELASVDAVTAARLHPNDAVRIVRALEVYYATGVSISEYQSADRSRAKRRSARQFGLTLPRVALNDRIEKRVDDMLAAGLEAEVRGLLRQGFGPELGPMRSLGYKEMVQYINHEIDANEASCAIKQNTRRYAKRQQTWFRADSAIEWIDVSALSSATVASQILARLESDTLSEKSS